MIIWIPLYKIVPQYISSKLFGCLLKSTVLRCWCPPCVHCPMRAIGNAGHLCILEMSPGKTKSCECEWEHSAKIVVQFEPLISVEQWPLPPRVNRFLFPCECMCLVAISRHRQCLSAFLLYGHKCKTISSGSMLVIPQHLPVFSGSVALDLYFGEAGSLLSLFFCSSVYLYRKKYTCCLPEHLLCPATLSLLQFCPN